MCVRVRCCARLCVSVRTRQRASNRGRRHGFLGHPSFDINVADVGVQRQLMVLSVDGHKVTAFDG